MPQGNAAAAAALLDHGGDAGDAVMARWLQSAGLQHLASPLASTAIDHRLLPNLLMQVSHYRNINVLGFCNFSNFPFVEVILRIIIIFISCFSSERVK